MMRTLALAFHSIWNGYWKTRKILIQLHEFTILEGVGSEHI